MVTKLSKIMTAFIAATILTAAASAQILIVDLERLNREAAAYKDFNNQTGTLQEDIVKLQNFLRRGGGAEQAMSELEKQKALTGADKYEESKKNLQLQYNGAQRELQVRQLRAEELYKEANRQVARARGPVITQLLKEHKAQVILYKGNILGHAAGIDITTSFIELLNEALPVVNLPQLQAAAKPAAK